VSDRTDPFAPSDSGGPSPRAADASRLYDHGQPRCVQAWTRSSVGVTACLASPLRLGQRRDNRPDVSTQVVIDRWVTDGGDLARGSTVSDAEALRLAGVLIHLADELLFAQRLCA